MLNLTTKQMLIIVKSIVYLYIQNIGSVSLISVFVLCNQSVVSKETVLKNILQRHIKT